MDLVEVHLVLALTTDYLLAFVVDKEAFLPVPTNYRRLESSNFHPVVVECVGHDCMIEEL